MLSLLYQESWCVVQEAAKATAEASFQEGGVLWRDVLRQQAHRAAGSVTAGLSICREKIKTGLLFHPHLIFWNLHVRVKLKNLCVSEGRSGSYSVLGGRSLRGWERSAADTWTSLCRQCEPAHKHSGGPCRTDDGREEFTFTRVTIQVPEYFCI